MGYSRSPWFFEPDQFNGSKGEDQTGSICSDNGWFIAAIEEVADATEDNITLIVAAPEMLELLEKISLKWECLEAGNARVELEGELQLLLRRIKGEKP